VLLEQVLHRFHEQEANLQKDGGAIPHLVDESIGVEVFAVCPEVRQRLSPAEIDGYSAD
jgi:hypothetical protein